MTSIPLCDLDDIEDGQSAGFAVQTDGGRVGIMAIRQAEAVYTYVNSCPHIGTPLDFKPGQFLDMAREYILCSTHGALFRISDGDCISGPCAGKSLKQVPNDIRDGTVYVRP